ncbi:MAG: DUF2914 domain-containing protein [Fibrobacteres bacterium]|nr:DUF2914 domain-containing protein [Fibrobacterota bacterium]
MFRNKKLRPWPVFLLLFLVLGMTINTITRKSRTLSFDKASQELSTYEKYGFTAFNSAIKADCCPSDTTIAAKTFSFTPDRKTLVLTCSGAFSKTGTADFRLFAVWYKSNTIMYTDTLWLNPSDSVFSSTMSVQRNDTGNWSIDLMYKNNILLKTHSFAVNRESYK